MGRNRRPRKYVRRVCCLCFIQSPLMLMLSYSQAACQPKSKGTIGSFYVAVPHAGKRKRSMAVQFCSSVIIVTRKMQGIFLFVKAWSHSTAVVCWFSLQLLYTTTIAFLTLASIPTYYVSRGVRSHHNNQQSPRIRSSKNQNIRFTHMFLKKKQVGLTIIEWS